MNNINFLITNALIFGAVVTILILRWRRRKLGENQWILSYPASLKILSAVGLLFVYTSVSVVIELTPGWEAKMLVIVLSIPAGVLVFMAAAEVFASETSYDDLTISRCTPWRQTITVPFNDIVRIDNALLQIQFAIHSRDGQVIRVCKWTERADEVLGYAQEGLEAQNESSEMVA